MWKCPKGCHEDSEFRVISGEIVHKHFIHYVNGEKCTGSGKDSQVTKLLDPACSLCGAKVTWVKDVRSRRFRAYDVHWSSYDKNNKTKRVELGPGVRGGGEGNSIDLYRVLVEFNVHAASEKDVVIHSIEYASETFPEEE